MYVIIAYLKLFLTNAKTLQWKMGVPFQQMVLEHGYPYAKRTSIIPPTYIKINSKMDHKPK